MYVNGVVVVATKLPEFWKKISYYKDCICIALWF